MIASTAQRVAMRVQIQLAAADREHMSRAAEGL